MNNSLEKMPELQMSSFVALENLRRYLRKHPNTHFIEAVNALRRLDADMTAVDFEGGLRLHQELPESLDFLSPVISIRQGIKILIEKYNPWWCRFFTHGRKRVATALSRNEHQTFRSAGLFDEVADDDVVEWWDYFASKMRSIEDEQLNLQGRYAEKLSLEHEEARLLALGISERPRWVALDDNSAGYDILSYSLTPDGIRNLLIEVKSSQRALARMIISRGEWDMAKKYRDAYIFHFWSLPKEKLKVYSVLDIAGNIPIDQGSGHWTETAVELNS